ncbi:hypothetical protein SDC9_86177 [bioreactor metagenome]|uniref:Uncharacterized protein n=1 Tax=bioreactor metagenome TaxID=1076179 RepID=A0A644ZLG8_9ZZZZ
MQKLHAGTWVRKGPSLVGTMCNRRSLLEGILKKALIAKVIKTVASVQPRAVCPRLPSALQGRGVCPGGVEGFQLLRHPLPVLPVGHAKPAVGGVKHGDFQRAVL